ncbi:MAG: hypothetical protein EB117_16715 [Betaproteobacteria bacterium]|nr:hypothetical protein [Betaproteobacteria bacterium]
MNDRKKLETMVSFIESEIEKNNELFDSLKFDLFANLADKSFYFGRMDALLDIRDRLTKLEFDLYKTKKVDVNEY